MGKKIWGVLLLFQFSFLWANESSQPKFSEDLVYQLVYQLFTAPQTSERYSLQKQVITEGDKQVLDYIIEEFDTFEKNFKRKKDLLEMLIEKASPDLDAELASRVFPMPESFKFLKAFIQKTDQRGLKFLASYTLNQPHVLNNAEILKLAAQRAESPETISSILWSVVIMGGTDQRISIKQELLNILLRKDGVDSDFLARTFRYIFSQSEYLNMVAEFKLAIEKVEKHDEKVQMILEKEVFARSNKNAPWLPIFKKSLEIENHEKRKTFIELEFKNQFIFTMPYDFESQNKQKKCQGYLN